MSMSHDPLKITTRPLHRFWILIESEKQWYTIINECRQLYGRDWQSTKGVRKKLRPSLARRKNILRTIYGTPHSRVSQMMALLKCPPIWFDVPDSTWATWIAIKYGVEVVSDLKNYTVNNKLCY
jgi:hypothetical protein